MVVCALMGHIQAPRWRRAAMQVWAALVALAAAAGAGCSCAGDSDADRFCAELAGLQCDHEIACGRTSADHREQCQTSRVARLCGDNPDRVAIGLARFDAEQGQQCLAESRPHLGECSRPTIAALYATAPGMAAVGVAPEWPTCNPGPYEPPPQPACARVFSGASQTGDRCRHLADCAAEEDGCALSGCDGACKPAGAVGEPCGRTGCDPGLYCHSPTNTCEVAAPIGGECDLFRECDAKVARCDWGTQRCVALPIEGEACLYGWLCSPGHYCNRQTGSDVCARASELNEPCDGYGTCVPGLFCVSGTCVVPGNEGDSCSGFVGCRDDLRCDNGVCVPRLGEHEACRQFVSDRDEVFLNCRQCQLEFTCDSVFSTCERPRLASDGEPCTGIALGCRDDLICRGAWVNPDGGVGVPGRCEPKQVGAPCMSRSDCPNESFCNLPGDGGTGLCTQAFDGSPCVTSSECLSGQYCDQQTSCRALKDEGEACEVSGYFGSTTASSCRPELTCQRASAGPICYRRRGVDESCDATMLEPCLFPLACVDGRCKEAGHLGEACLARGECLEGYCRSDVSGVGGQCEQLRGEGETCTAPFECASRWCDDGQCMAGCK